MRAVCSHSAKSTGQNAVRICVLIFAGALAVQDAKPLRGQAAQSAPAAQVQVTAPKPAAAAAPADSHQLIDDQCANLLKMANDLKAAVDKTTKDELSLAVVRKANEIEQLARRVRDEMKPAAGKN